MGRRLSTVVAILAVAGAATLGLPASSQAADCPDADAIPLLTLFNVQRLENSLLCLINQERIERGIGTVQPNGLLAAAAASHTSAMRWQSFFAHDSLDGTTFEKRIEATGYLNGAESWLVGENLGWGSSILGTPRSMVVAWMNSPPHRKNILEDSFDEIGIGADWGSPVGPWLPLSAIATTDFGTVDYTSPEAEKRAKSIAAKKKLKKKRKKRRKKRPGK